MAEEKEVKGTTRNFIDFILATKDNEALLTDFLKCRSAPDLEAFFADRGYTVTGKDCEKLIKAKEDLNIEDGVIPPAY